MPCAKTGNFISSIRKLNTGKVLLIIRKKKFLISEDSYLENYFYEGKKLSKEDMEFLEARVKSDDLYLYGKALAINNTLSPYQIEERIKKKNPSLAKEVILRLKEENFLSEKQYALDYLEKYLYEGYGIKKIKNDLIVSKRVSKDIVDNLPFSGEFDLEELIKKYEMMFNSYPFNKKKEKIINALLRRGFSFLESEKATNRYMKEKDKEKEQNLLKRDYLYLLDKYQKKYNGDDLKKKLLSSLLRKGYLEEDIQEVMEGI